MSETADLTSTPAPPVPEATAGQAEPDKKKKKKSKVRSAWISFVGRIVAQLCGAVAAVMLGLQLVQGYLPAPAAAAPASAAAQPESIVAPQRPQGFKTLAVLPVANYSGNPRHDAFSDGLTEALTAELAEASGLQVTSRTSSMHFRDQRELLPAIARKLGVDLVLESSVVTADSRVRITVQLIDAATDLHVWVKRYESADRDVLALHSALAQAVARDVHAAVFGQLE